MPMKLFHTPALVPLDLEVARLQRPRTWARVQADWAGDDLLASRDAAELITRLRGTSAEIDPLAGALVTRAAAGDRAALTVVLAALAGVFVAVARRRGGELDAMVADQLSLAAEIVATSPLPPDHVLATLVSRVQARHRRLRHRVRLLSGAPVVPEVPTTSDATEVAALGRVEVRRVGALVRRQIRAGVVSTDDWRRLVELRVHGDSSSAIAERDGLSPAVVRKRAQRTLQALVAV